MKKKLLTLILLSTFAMSLTACGTKRAEEQALIRDQGIVLLDDGNYAGAIEQFDLALGKSLGTITPMEIDICYYKASAQYKAGQFDDAINTYSALINYDSSNYKPHFLRGCIYANEKEFGKACEDYDKAVEMAPEEYQLYIQIYENLDALNQREKALEYLNYALEVKDKSPEGHYYKGRVFYILEQYEQAQEELQIAIDKNIVDAKLYMAKVYQATGDDANASVLLAEYAASDEVTSKSLSELGDIEMSYGNYEVALNYYNAGLGLEEKENYPQLIRGKAAALEHLGKFSEAAEVLANYVKEFPDDSEAAQEYIFLKSR